MKYRLRAITVRRNQNLAKVKDNLDTIVQGKSLICPIWRGPYPIGERGLIEESSHRAIFETDSDGFVTGVKTKVYFG